MNLVRTLPLVMALLVAAFASKSQSEEQQPETSPTRDVWSGGVGLDVYSVCARPYPSSGFKLRQQRV